jgi:L-lactate dehydrogenase (cytochrome)
MKSDRSLARAVAFPRVINIHDFRRLAKKRLPAVVFAYIDGGAEDEVTLRENVAAFGDITFRPRQCVAVPTCDLRTTVLGETFELPFLLAPVGFCRMFYPKGELHAARAANDAGTTYILSTFSGTRLEEVRAATSGPLWFQLYVPGGRDIAEATMARAKAAGYTVLVVTIDTPVSGMRERDFRYGVRPILQKDLWGSLPYAWQFVTRPRWVLDYFADGRPSVFPNVELPGKGAMPCGDVGMILESTIVTWDDFRWMRDAWKGPIVVKGVHTGDDAKRAIDAGAQGVVVSNHGGRQLDGVPATLRALPEVLDAVSGRIDVMLDGGIRRGGDVVKAIALGAKAVLVGRAYAWALGAAGGPGVARAIDILRTDIVRTLRLLGCPSIRDLDRSYISADTRHNSR